MYTVFEFRPTKLEIMTIELFLDIWFRYQVSFLLFCLFAFFTLLLLSPGLRTFFRNFCLSIYGFLPDPDFRNPKYCPCSAVHPFPKRQLIALVFPNPEIPKTASFRKQFGICAKSPSTLSGEKIYQKQFFAPLFLVLAYPFGWPAGWLTGCSLAGCYFSSRGPIQFSLRPAGLLICLAGGSKRQKMETGRRKKMFFTG